MEKSFELQVEPTKSGFPTLKICYEEKILYLHSKYNPIREAEIWAKNFYEKGKLSIVIGLGLGYYAKSLLDIMEKDDRILVIEPYKEILGVAENNDLAKLLRDPRVFVCLENDKNKLGQILRVLIKQKFLKNSKIFVAPNYDKITEVEIIISELKKAFGDYAVDINTKLALAFDWQQNYFRNIKYAIQSCPITAFESKFTCPIIIVSAGPSLQKELEKLKEVYHNALIISAGSATPVLLKNGVKPHIIVSIDGSKEMYAHFKDIKYEDIPLCYLPNHHYKISEQHTGRKIIFQARGMNIADWYNEVIGFATGTVQVGPSVANFCLDIACRLTNGPICFVGQDLGYVGGFSHAEGNDNRVSEEDTKQELQIVDSNDGNTLYTEYAFVLMREWFEKYLYVNPRENVYNTSLHGAKIQGTKVMGFNEFIYSFCQENIDAEQAIDDIVKDWETINNSKKADNDKILQELTENLQKVIAKTREANDLSKKLLDKVKGRNDKSIDNLLIKLSKVEKKIISLKNKDGLLFLIIQMIVDILIMWDEEDEDDYKKRVKIAEKNHFFYANLYNMSKTVKKMLDDLRV